MTHDHTNPTVTLADDTVAVVRQIAGLSDQDATRVFAAVAWLEAAPSLCGDYCVENGWERLQEALWDVLEEDNEVCQQSRRRRLPCSGTTKTAKSGRTCYRLPRPASPSASDRLRAPDRFSAFGRGTRQASLPVFEEQHDEPTTSRSSCV